MKFTLLRPHRMLIPLMALAFAANVLAAPYGPAGKAINWQQPTGEKIEMRVFGDEHYACTETLDGYTVVCDRPAKTYYYATLSADGNSLVATPMAAGTGDPRTLGLAKHLRINQAAALGIAKDRRARWEQGMKNSLRWQALKAEHRAIEQAAVNGPQYEPPTSTTTGTKVGLTLLIDFDNDPASVPQADIVNFCNGDNFTGYGNNGSVKEYFLDASNGSLNYTNVVTAYVRIPNSLHPKSWYCDTNKDAGAQANLLIRDAITIMKALPNYTSDIQPMFNALTVDSTNTAVAFNVFYAGGNGDTWAYGLWPHSWSLYDVGPQTLSPTRKVDSYQITNIGDSLEIGTFCHENGHMLCGFPDIYDYDYDSVGGAGFFCLMGSGAYGGPRGLEGTQPVNICAYLRCAAGWGTVSNYTSVSSYTATLESAPGSTTYNHFYRYPKPGTDTEYFLFENRNRSGRDQYIPASGIAIWHIDELGNKDNQSMVPNSNHANYEVTLVQADNQWHFETTTDNDGDAWDLYYEGNNTSLTDSTSPNAHWWNGNNSGLDVNTISAAGTTMTMQFGIGLDPDTIRVDAPNGGETVKHGEIRTVYWSSTVTGNVKIELYKGGSLYAVLSENETNDGSYAWDVSPDITPGTNYRIKVSSLTNPVYAEDTSNADFSIVAAPPTITSALMVIGVKNIQFNYQITATNRPTSYGATSLPTGLGVNPLTGLISGVPTVSGTFDIGLSATNAIGTGTATLRLYVDATNISLEEALDNPNLKWTMGGASGWVVVTSGTHDGVDAVQSRPLADNQENWIETTVTGPGELSFWWMVSSETYDKLHFTIDGIETLGAGGVSPIGGNSGWKKQSTEVDEGEHTLRWTYAKDSSVSLLSDTGWLDQVTFTSVTRTPEISVEQPEDTILTDGSATAVNFGTVIFGSSTSLTFTVNNLGDAALNLTGITIDGTNSSDYTVTAQPTSPVPRMDGTTVYSTTFTVQLTPSSATPAVRTATLHLANNDLDENPFDIKLTGTVAPTQEFPGGSLTIPVVGNATPWPSNVTVSGLSGAVLSVKVKINGLTHPYPDDIDMYLAAPNGKVCALMSDAGGSIAVSNKNLVFDDAADTVIPDESGITSRSYRPYNYVSTYDSVPSGVSGLTAVSTLNALGTGTINGTWKLYVADDTNMSSGSITSWSLVIETGKPEIVVEYPSGNSLVDGTSTIEFGYVDIHADSGEFLVTVKNTGTDTLSGLAITKNGTNAANFEVGSLGATSLAPNTSTTFTIKYTPTIIGQQTAAIHIASNDQDENPFDLALLGTGYGTGLQAWRKTNFGSYDDTGDGADLADPDHDGIANLLEFGFGLNPKQASNGKLPVPQVIDGNMVIRFTEPDGATGITYGAEWSQSLAPGGWTQIQDIGLPPEHIFSVPTSDKAKLYMRLKVTNP